MSWPNRWQHQAFFPSLAQKTQTLQKELEIQVRIICGNFVDFANGVHFYRKITGSVLAQFIRKAKVRIVSNTFAYKMSNEMIRLKSYK